MSFYPTLEDMKVDHMMKVSERSLTLKDLILLISQYYVS